VTLKDFYILHRATIVKIELLDEGVTSHYTTDALISPGEFKTNIVAEQATTMFCHFCMFISYLLPLMHVLWYASSNTPLGWTLLRHVRRSSALALLASLDKRPGSRETPSRVVKAMVCLSVDC
jgi:hypothetical protein